MIIVAIKAIIAPIFHIIVVFLNILLNIIAVPKAAKSPMNIAGNISNIQLEQLLVFRMVKGHWEVLQMD